ncbi:CvpA family protein [Rickettsiales bacterium]|nr:CvpA family protein [Rickettsiales bacterium]
MELYLIFDIAIIFFILISAIFSFTRGFSQEILSLISWVSAFFISFFLSIYLISHVDKIINNLVISKIFTYLIVFILSLFFLSFFTSRFASSVKRSSVGMLDRSLGFVFGIARGYILLALCLYLFNSLYSEKNPKWIEKSKMNDLLRYGSIKIISMFDKNNDSIKDVENQLNKKSEELFEKSIDSYLRRERKMNSESEGYKKRDRDNLEYLIESTEDD